MVNAKPQMVPKPERSDGYHIVVLGKVKDGMSIVEAVECFESRNGKTRKTLPGLPVDSLMLCLGAS